MTFVRLQIPRIRWTRYGLTNGRDWSTATGVRFTYKSVAGATGVVKFDDLTIKAGADGRILSGIYKLRQRYVFSDGTFVDYSPAGPPTPDIFIDGQAINATLSLNTINDMDPQVTAVWNYLFSDKLGAYFKVRDYMDLTMSKFCLNEFDVVQHSGVNANDMTRHCTSGLLIGKRYLASDIYQTSSASTSTTEVPYTSTPTLSVGSYDTSFWSGTYITYGPGTQYVYFSSTALSLNASLISSVRLRAYMYNNSYPESFDVYGTPFFRYAGTNYYGAAFAVGTSAVTVENTWTLSPVTGLPFTETELNSGQFGVRFQVNDSSWLRMSDGSWDLTVNYNVTETVVISVDDSYNPFQMLINSSDTDLLLDNQVLDTEENVPPSDVIQIVGPHYGRLLCVTKTHIYPSQPNSPSLFKYAYAFRVGDAKTETALWAEVMGGSLFVGTTVDIYRYDGDFQVLPNDTLNFNRVALGLGNPPIDSSHAINDDMLVFHASDGYRVLVGNSSTSINYNMDLLNTGYDRHGISKSTPGVGVRSIAFGSRGLHTLFPYTDNVTIRLNEFVEPGTTDFSSFVGFNELTAGFSSPASYTSRVPMFSVGPKEWSYNTYPVDITCLYRTSTGRLVAGTKDGRVIQLEKGSGDLDSTTSVVVRNPYLDGGLPLTHKELFELAIIADTGGANMTYEVYDDINASAIVSDSAALTGRGILRRNMNGLKARRFQLRLSGDFTTLRLYDFNMSLRPVPQHRTYLDTGNIRVGAEEFHWYRQIRIMAIAAADFVVDVYFDDTLLYSESLTAVVGTAKIYIVDLQEDASGRQPRLVIRTGTAAAEATTDIGFEVYWVEWVARTSGRKNKQPRVRWDNSTNDNVPPE